MERGYRFQMGIGKKVIGIIILVIAGVFVFGSIVMLLWNALMPVIFHLPLIGFWQALGLLILTKILFSGFRGGHRIGQSKRERLKDAWATMTPEQQEKFRQEWGRRCRKPFSPDSRFDRAETVNRSNDPGPASRSTDPNSSEPKS